MRTVRRGAIAWCASAWLVCAQAARAEDNVLELDAALSTAKEHAPELREAQANLQAARARVDTARAPMLPQVTATAGYNRSTFNFARGQTTSGSTPASTFQTRNVFSIGLRATQLIWDFGQTSGLKDVANQTAQAQALQARAMQLEIDYGVRSAYWNAGRARALVDVAQATLSNQQRHLAQIQGFVEVGTRPAIDLAQSRTDVANAQLALLRAQNDYLAAKAQLSRSMGTPEASDYEVSTALPGAEPDEDAAVEVLTQHGLQQRPEFQAFQAQLQAQEASLHSIQGQYGPTLNLVGSADMQGLQLDRLAPNVSVGAALNWPLYQGGLTNSRVSESRALTIALQAQLETLSQDLRVAINQAGLTIRAARAALEVANELVQLAQERLTLAEGRYAAGVGNTIELGDAELALRDAQTQRVTAEYDLALARALLRRTVGRL